MTINLVGLVADLNQALEKYGLVVRYAGITPTPPNPHSDALPNGSEAIRDAYPNSHPEAGNRGAEPSSTSDLERKKNNLRRLLGRN